MLRKGESGLGGERGKGRSKISYVIKGLSCSFVACGRLEPDVSHYLERERKEVGKSGRKVSWKGEGKGGRLVTYIIKEVSGSVSVLWLT